MSTISPPSFTGTSKYASSLQQVLSRAVGIAALPLDSLSAGLTTLQDRQGGLQGLDIRFAGLQAALGNIQNAVTSNTLNSSISDGSIVSASLSNGATQGTYSIEVTSLGSFSTAISSAGASPVTDPAASSISASATFTLNFGGVPTTITPASTSLKDLAAAINEQSDDVHATIVNAGSSGSPDYRLSLRAAKLGASAIDLLDSDSASLITDSTTGTLATYKLDGLSSTISSDSRTVTVAPGLTVNLLSQSAAGFATTITVQNNSTGIASAFSSFAQAWNSATDEIAKHRGTGGGSLQGDSILSSLSGLLHQLSGYSAGTADTALANYGVTVDKDGRMAVSTATFSKAADSNFTTTLALLGDTSAGGFLKTANDLLNSVNDATNGTLKLQENSATTQIDSQTAKIAKERDRVLELQANLTQRLAKADAAIAALESQVSYVNGLFHSITGDNNSSGS